MAIKGYLYLQYHVDSTNEISLEELFANSIADDFSFIISKDFGKISLFFLYLTPKLSGISEKIFKFAFKYNIL